MYDIALDSATKMLTIAYAGFVDADEVSDSFKEEQRRVDATRCGNLDHLLPIDGRALAVLSQAVVAHIVTALRARRGEIMASGRRLRRARRAVCSPFATCRS